MSRRLLCMILLVPLASPGMASAEGVNEGEKLARLHCASCHGFPEPDLLPERSWKITLSYMGLRMGIEDLTQFDPDHQQREIDLIGNRKQLIIREGAMPEAPTVTTGQWVAIRDYYLDHAPDAPLPQAGKPPLQVGLTQFHVREPDYDRRLPITTMIHFDERHDEVLIGDSGYERLGAFDNRWELKTDYATKGHLWVDAIQQGGRLHLLSIGDLMGGQAESKIGRISYAVRAGDRWANQGVALSGLHRPVDMELGDFDRDGVDELVVTNYGFGSGSVDIHRFMENGWQLAPEPVVRLAVDPGAMACKVADFNDDGWPDVAVLFGEARENLSLFLNRGDGGFERLRIIEAHPSFGFVGFQWVDFDRDGDLDVFTVNGDNVDSDPYNTLKPDHGIRLYLNDGELNFDERYFYPMHGAYGMQAHDFDLDGDLDIAAVAFNPDFGAGTNEGFVYLENLGGMRFTAQTFEMPKTDRWITIGAGDYDDDGDVDLTLGGGYVPAGLSFDHVQLMKDMAEEGRPLIILENRCK